MTDVLPSPCSRRPDALRCRSVQGPDELATHHRIRRAVFVQEQRLFDGDDRDSHDDDAQVVHVLGFVDDEPAGTVRLYPLSDGVWKGDRLAVLPEHRHAGIGAPLVRTAVATAAAAGGRRMDATVQAVNTTFFVHLGWTPVGEPADYLGVLHQDMTIAL
ncbi:MAG: GCN5-related N-acetyltransferase [Frankiales bacterium]|nr:GCN5-related N-acetyltransferase [Frankiales bacterium]